MTRPITRCVSCGSTDIRNARGQFSVTAHGEMVNIPDIERYTCARCGETFLDLDNETKIDGYLQTRRTRTKTATTRSP